MSGIGDEDCNAAALIIEEAWPDYVDLFRREMKVYREHSTLFEPFFVLAKSEEKLVGFSLLVASMMSTDLLTITWVAVHPDNRNCGIGRRLIDICLQTAQQRAKAVVLTTSAPEFYRKIDFRVVDEYSADEKSFLLMYKHEDTSLNVGK
jgi:N-acetylglutamate synthase-like GNAT family acetyltransferase